MSWGLEDYTYDIGMGDLSLGAGFMYSLGDCTLWLFKVSLENHYYFDGKSMEIIVDYLYIIGPFSMATCM